MVSCAQVVNPRTLRRLPIGAQVINRYQPAPHAETDPLPVYDFDAPLMMVSDSSIGNSRGRLVAYALDEAASRQKHGTASLVCQNDCIRGRSQVPARARLEMLG
jgi:hypothetical protein